MRKFEPSKKGVISFQDKEYRLKIDSVTLTLVMVDSVQKLESERKKANDLQKSFDSGEIAIDTFIEEDEVALDNISKQSERFCRRMLGNKAFDEIENASHGLTFDDYTQLTTLIMGELSDIKSETNNSLTKGVEKYE